jgi:hypothetical protein
VGQACTRFGRVRERRGKAEASDAELLRKNRWRVVGLLREMREHGGVDPDYTTGHREEYSSGHSPPTTIPGKLLRHPRNLVIVELFSSSILFATGIHFPLVLLYNQGYPKVCPDSLNLPNAGNPFAGISSLSSCSLFSPTRDLNALI